MPEARRTAPTSGPEIELVQKSAPEKYFNLPMTVMLFTGMYPISSERGVFIRLLYSTYFGLLFIFAVVLTPVSKAFALPYLTNINDLTENISFLLNHTMGVFKIVIFMYKRKDLIRIVETIQSQKFRHQDCYSETFSANRLIRKAVRTSKAIYYFFSSFIISLIPTSFLRVIMYQTQVPIKEISGPNVTESSEVGLQHERRLPFHGWYPFSTQISPNYEIIFVYQLLAVVTSAYMVLASDTMLVSFMAHIKVQFQILSHNLRFIKSQAKNKLRNPGTASQTIGNGINDIMESDLEKYIEHHQRIIQLSQDLESVFTYQILLQFMCSLLSICMLLWQVSSVPIFSAEFVYMLIYFVAVGCQLFMYCWFGNEMMLESLSVADAAWDSGWNEISSRRYCYGIVMIIQRSQKVMMITAGGFADLTLETFMTISQGAYSCFAVLKKMNS